MWVVPVPRKGSWIMYGWRAEASRKACIHSFLSALLVWYDEVFEAPGWDEHFSPLRCFWSWCLITTTEMKPLFPWSCLTIITWQDLKSPWRYAFGCVYEDVTREAKGRWEVPLWRWIVLFHGLGFQAEYKGVKVEHQPSFIPLPSGCVGSETKSLGIGIMCTGLHLLRLTQLA